MIHFATETLLSFSEACKRLPRRRAGRPAHPATLYRWATKGIRGVRLETIRVGGSLCTSLEALQRFFDCLSDADRPRPDRSVSSEDRGHGERPAAGRRDSP